MCQHLFGLNSSTHGWQLGLGLQQVCTPRVRYAAQVWLQELVAELTEVGSTFIQNLTLNAVQSSGVAGHNWQLLWFLCLCWLHGCYSSSDVHLSTTTRNCLHVFWWRGNFCLFLSSTCVETALVLLACWMVIRGAANSPTGHTRTRIAIHCKWRNLQTMVATLVSSAFVTNYAWQYACCMTSGKQMCTARHRRTLCCGVWSATVLCMLAARLLLQMLLSATDWWGDVVYLELHHAVDNVCCFVTTAPLISHDYVIQY